MTILKTLWTFMFLLCVAYPVILVVRSLFRILGGIFFVCGFHRRGLYQLNADVMMALVWLLFLFAEGRKAADQAEIEITAEAAKVRRGKA